MKSTFVTTTANSAHPEAARSLGRLNSATLRFALYLLIIGILPEGYGATSAPAGVLLAADGLSHQVMLLDLSTSTPPRPFTSGATMDFLSDMVFGPDGHLYVLDGHYDEGTNRVLRFNGRTGALIDVFSQLGPEGWDGSLTFSPEGSMYVICSWQTIRRYNGTTGELVGDVLSLVDSTLYSITVGPDSRLYFTGGDYFDLQFGMIDFGFIARSRFDGTQLEILDSGGGSNGPRKPVWDREGNFYAADLNDGVVRQYEGKTGQLIGVFADPPGTGTVALAFGANGLLYISRVWDSAIFCANGTNGMILGTLTTNVQAAALISVPAPEITAQPQAQTTRQGGTAAFGLACRSVAVASYQWNLDGVPIEGATNASLTLVGVTTNQAGNYSAVVSNIGGAVTSQVATLTVLLPARLSITGVSSNGTCAILLTGDDTGIYAIESSTNLTDWAWLGTWWARKPPVGTFYEPLAPKRFFRARLLP
jgi:sugar lactone lactonase YvrE